jgi:protein ImuA
MACTLSRTFLSPETARRLERLRDDLALLERTSHPLTLDIPVIDAALGGGLARGALHEIAATGESATSAATAFALVLTGRAARMSAHSPGQNSDVLWIAEDLSLAENGAPYGPGLDYVGVAPEQLITVAAPRLRDVLWAMEEALRCRAVDVVIGEIRARGIDQVTTRRLSLAAIAGDTLGILLRTVPDDEPSACATRWVVGTSPSRLQSLSPAMAGERFHGIGPPRLELRLVRNRRGRLGAWIVEWNSVEQRFELATHSEPLAGAAFDRPHRAPAG